MKILITCLAVFAIACGSSKGNNDSMGGDDAGGDDGDGGFIINDAPFSGSCNPNPGAPQCSNCMDDDGDGRIDGFDIQCTGPLDNDEASFATGIPGDNMDAVNQDCFFDGDSGAGNDRCNIHVCCLLGATTKQMCTIGQNQYNPMDCPPPIGTKPLAQKCIDTCGKLTPPGCDCFACCTLCDPASNMCYDIATNPNTSPNCTTADLADPTKCLPCQKVTSCGNTTCGGTSCILCPGQDPNDLPPECNGAMCPQGQAPCSGIDNTCAEGTFCSNGCCIGTLM